MISFKNSFLVALLGFAVFIVNCQGGPPDMPFFPADKKVDVDKCLTEAGLTKEDLKPMTDEPNTKQLCFGKCIMTSAGFLNADGTINSDEIKKAIPPVFDAATASTIIKCVGDVGKVATCDDMAKVLKCVPKPPKQ